MKTGLSLSESHRLTPVRPACVGQRVLRQSSRYLMRFVNVLQELDSLYAAPTHFKVELEQRLNVIAAR